MTFFTQVRPSHRNRWSDRDWYFGPFTYAKDKYPSLGVILFSGDEDEHIGCGLRIRGFGHTLIIHLPQIINPAKEIVTYTLPARDQTPEKKTSTYTNWHEKEYGFNYHKEGDGGGFLQIFYGQRTHDSTTDKTWSWFTPWNQWHFVRKSYYDLEGNHFATEPKRKKGAPYIFDNWKAIEDSCPKVVFSFKDYDGELLNVTTHITEREWHRGEGWFRWLSLFKKPILRRSLSLEFSGETGSRKESSWKGGTIGTEIDLLPGELHEAAFKRYCEKNKMTFLKRTFDVITA